MLDDVRRNMRGFVEAGMAAVSGALTPARAKDLARSLTGGEGPTKQVNRVAQDLLEWSQRSREWISEAVAKEVKRQLSALGIATKEDLDSLRKRVRELERAAKSGAKSGGSGASKKTSGSRAKRSTAPAKRAVADAATEAPGLGDPGAGAT